MALEVQENSFKISPSNPNVIRGLRNADNVCENEFGDRFRNIPLDSWMDYTQETRGSPNLTWSSWWPQVRPDFPSGSRSCINDHAHVVNGDAGFGDVGCQDNFSNIGRWSIKHQPETDVLVVHGDKCQHCMKMPTLGCFDGIGSTSKWLLIFMMQGAMQVHDPGICRLLGQELSGRVVDIKLTCWVNCQFTNSCCVQCLRQTKQGTNIDPIFCQQAIDAHHTKKLSFSSKWNGSYCEHVGNNSYTQYTYWIINLSMKILLLTSIAW